MAINKVPGGRVGQVEGMQGTEPTVSLNPQGSTTLQFRASPRVRVAFRTRGKTNGATLAADSAMSGDDGSVAVQVTAGDATSFSVVCTEDGKEVGSVHVVVKAMLQGKEVSASGRVPPKVALEIQDLVKNGDLRGALFLLSEHDETVKKSLNMGHGNVIASVSDAFNLARSSNS
ncbi:MAG: hypothetical protein IT381_23430 [Deltaproteobacteria bacterium]|nr:hypothetical protein [Deltaproteobacteria bacterium]